VHHRVAWLARESSKPGREQVERWTVQASAAWSQEHLEDAPDRVQAKLLKAFSEITGIRATPAHAEVHRWRYAKTLQPLGATHMLSKRARYRFVRRLVYWVTVWKMRSFPVWNWRSQHFDLNDSR
jgi:renalase